MSNPKIAVYSLPDLKNTTDDALPNYLKSLKFKQSHFLTDVRLSLGYSAVVIAAITFGLDYKLGWDKTKDLTLWAVVAYFVLNGALTYWIWGVEKGKIFAGENDHAMLTVASKVTKHTPVYNLTVRHANTSGNRISWKTSEISAPFTRWFDADGHFIAQPFQQWLATEIPIIGQADTRNVVRVSQETAEGSEKTDGQTTTKGLEVDTPRKAAQSTGTSTGTRSRKSKK
ncbi:hypothetical protein MMC07_004283 [Pseudocyphellaria aurata]|nr:hypothetical protein [Pseudocyphellaria aurata]